MNQPFHVQHPSRSHDPISSSSSSSRPHAPMSSSLPFLLLDDRFYCRCLLSLFLLSIQKKKTSSTTTTSNWAAFIVTEDTEMTMGRDGAAGWGPFGAFWAAGGQVKPRWGLQIPSLPPSLSPYSTRRGACEDGETLNPMQLQPPRAHCACPPPPGRLPLH